MRIPLLPLLSLSLLMLTRPEASRAQTPREDFLKRWAFQYKYDGRKRMVEKQVPGADPVYMVYDNRDRLVLTQDGEQRKKNEWLFTKYDALNRPILTGIHDTTVVLTQPQMQAVVDNHYLRPSAVFYETLSGTVHGYTNKSYPIQSDVDKYLTVTYYDDYGFQSALPEFGPEFGYVKPTTPGCQTVSQGTYCYENAEFATVKGQVTGTKVKILSTNQWVKTVTYYDDRYRVIQTVLVNDYHNVTERISHLYNFPGWLLETYKEQSRGAQTLGLRTRSVYDHSGRLKKGYHELYEDGAGRGEVLLLQKEYNELGELIEKNLHVSGPEADPLVGRQGTLYGDDLTLHAYDGSNAIVATKSVRLMPGFTARGSDKELTVRIGYSEAEARNRTKVAQSIDYRYNIRGWLTRINDSGLTESEPQAAGDYFGMELGYNTTLTGVSATPAWNGNISAVKWSDDLGQNTRAYSYTYDAMDRIKTADSYKTGADIPAFDVNGITYDFNGNIRTLTRNNSLGTGLDALVYDYGTGAAQSNQLLSVTDNADDQEGFKDGNTSGNDYLYDDNGNMTRDLNKGITSIAYNHLNLPNRVEKDADNYILYTYDAAGIKLKQQVYEGDTLSKTTDYIGEFIYETPGTGSREIAFIQHEEGRIVPDATNGGWDYEYYLKDHLGNTRVVFTTDLKTHDFTLNYEGLGNDDDGLFLDSARISNDIFDHTDQAGNTYTHAQRLTGADGQRIGSVIALPVGMGDTISVETFAKYYDPAGNSSNGALPALATSLIGAFTGSTGTTSELGNQSINNSFGSGSLIGTAGFPSDNTAPMAFLNLMFLPDGELITFENNVSFAYDQIDPGAIQPQSAVKAPHDRLAIEGFISPVNGYVVVYLSNESDVFTEVYFDDLRITVNEHPVVQRDDYYPFGLTFNSYQRVTAKENNYLYNGKEKITDLDLNWMDYGSRMYMPDLGRWGVVDPKAESYEAASPYSYAFNNPIRFVDLQGEDPGDVVVVFAGADLFSNKGLGSTPQLVSAINREYINKNGGSAKAFYSTYWKEEVYQGYAGTSVGYVRDGDLDKATQVAYDYILEARKNSEGRVVIYGYSYGGVLANHLAKRLKEDNIDVNLLVTVDAAAGYQSDEVDRTISDNVEENKNYYQTEPSIIGSHGGENKAEDESKTRVSNNVKISFTDPEGKKRTVTHSNIDEATFKEVLDAIVNYLNYSK